MSAVLMSALDGLLAVAVVALAGLALLVRDRVTAVVLFLAFGLVLALVWVRLRAPDVALAEAALGAGLTGALLLDAVRPGTRSSGADGAAGGRRATVVLGLALAVPLAALLGTAAWTMRDAGGLRDLVEARLADSGVSNPVTAVLLNFRSYDTLLEVVVLLAAALAVLALQPGDDLEALPLPPPAEPVLQTLVRVVVPVSIVVSGWLLLLGTTRPGGAFQAGALLAGALVLLRVTGHRSPAPGRRSLRGLLVAGTVAFLGLAVATALIGGGLLVLDPSWADLAVLVIETALTLSIAVTLAELYVADQPAPSGAGGAGR